MSSNASKQFLKATFLFPNTKNEHSLKFLQNFNILNAAFLLVFESI
jgi:hypothetical protein